MSVLPSNLPRTALALLLLAFATQLLEVGFEKLFLLQDITAFEAYQQAEALGMNKALAVEQVSGKSASYFVTMLYWHPALGSFIASMLGCLTAVGLAWWRRVPWWVPLLTLPITIALNWSGLKNILRQPLLYLVNHLRSNLSLTSKFWLLGGLGIGCFILLALVAARVLPTYSRAQAASVPGPRSSA